LGHTSPYSSLRLSQSELTSFPYSVKLFGRDGFDKLAMRFKFSPQIPRRASRTISQVIKRGIADLALHNLLSHRELEHHQIGIISKSLTSRQQHEPGSFPMAS
jgi:hypothetical protein